jgi:Domain of Unknown Function (DUF1543)
VRLFVVLLGGTHPKAKIEIHDIAFAVGESLASARSQLLDQWFGAKKGVHIDAWMQVDGVDGYKISFEDHKPAPKSPRLYFIHTGGYDSTRFGEEHGYELIVAASPAEAKASAKRRRAVGWDKPHTDAVKDVDACIPVENIGGLFVHLRFSKHAALVFENTYLPLDTLLVT